LSLPRRDEAGGRGDLARGGGVDARVVVEEDVDVVEGGAQLVAQDLELLEEGDHIEDMSLDKLQALAAQPDDVEVEVERLGRAGGVELAQLARAHELLGEEDGEAEELEEERRQQWVVGGDVLREGAEELLVNLRGGHEVGD